MSNEDAISNNSIKSSGNNVDGDEADLDHVIKTTSNLRLSESESVSNERQQQRGFHTSTPNGRDTTVKINSTSAVDNDDFDDALAHTTPLAGSHGAVGCARRANSHTEMRRDGSTGADAASQVSQRSQHSQTEERSSTADSGLSGGLKRTTRVYYHIDEEPTPYSTEVPVPPERISLGDFKAVLNRSNYTYFYTTIDPAIGEDKEVKMQIRDDSQLLCPSTNGRFELFLLTAEGSSHSGQSGSTAFSKTRHGIPPAPTFYETGQKKPPSFYYPDHHRSTYNRPLPSRFLDQGHRHRIPPPTFEDSTIYTESDAHIYSDDESRVSTSTDNITSVSRQHYNGSHLYRKRNRRQYHRRQPSRASSLSSMTETSMQLNVVTVTLNMEPVSLLGINVIGQSCSRGDNGIYVASIIPGSAAALDGRIEPGDMILEVNNISFEKLSNDQAVDVLKTAVGKPGPLKLTVAKCFDGGARSNYFAVPAREPVRPIDTLAWVQHTNAVRTMTGGMMNAIPEESAPTPIPGQQHSVSHHHVAQHHIQQPLHITYPQSHSTAYANGGAGAPSLMTTTGGGGFVTRPPSSSATTSNGSAECANSALLSALFTNAGALRIPPMVSTSATNNNNNNGSRIGQPMQSRFDVHADRRAIVRAMLQPNSGLDIRDRTWLKIPIPMSFLGSDLVDWLASRVDGLRDRKDARKYAAELLRARLIAHVVDKSSFSEQCYYVVGEEYAEFFRIEQQQQQQQQQQQYNYQHQSQQHSQQQYYLHQQQQHQQQQQQQQRGWMPAQHQFNVAHSSVNDYASLPPAASPYPQTDGSIWPPPPPPPGGMCAPPGQPAAPIATHSQANSSHSNEGGGPGGGNSSGGGSSATAEHRRKAILPPAPIKMAMPGGSVQPPAQPMGTFYRHHHNHQHSQQQQHSSNSGGANYAGGDFIFQHL